MLAPPPSELHERFSAPGTEAVPWTAAERVLRTAEIYWLSTVQPDGRPHVTPVIAVWADGAAYFCTGPDERKARNLADDPRCVLTTGTNRLHEGLDVVVEGVAVAITETGRLTAIAAAYLDEYGDEWRFEVRDGAFFHPGADGGATVFEVAPRTVFGFGRDPYSQTRWRFGAGRG